MKQTRVTTFKVETTGSMQWRNQGRGQGSPAPPSLFLDKTEAPRAEKTFLETPPFLRVWMTAPPPPLSQGLYPAVYPALHCYLDYGQSPLFLIVRRAKRARHANGHVSPLLDARARVLSPQYMRRKKKTARRV